MDIVRTAENYRSKNQLSNTIIARSLIHKGNPASATVPAATWVDEVRL
jgi:hypothetical protein